MQRAYIGVPAAIVIFAIVGALASLGAINLKQFLTDTSVALVPIALGILYWSFKGSIDKATDPKPKYHVPKYAEPTPEQPRKQSIAIRTVTRSEKLNAIAVVLVGGIGGGVTFIYIALQIMTYANPLVTVVSFGGGIFLIIFGIWRTIGIITGKYTPNRPGS